MYKIAELSLKSEFSNLSVTNLGVEIIISTLELVTANIFLTPMRKS
jgi:hypothetical protein